MKKISISNFYHSLDIKEHELYPETVKLISNENFNYTLLSEQEKELVYRDVIDKIRKDTQKIGSPERKSTWQKGWSENLASYSLDKDNLSTLIPKFIRPTDIIRLFGQYVKPENKMFELSYFKIIRDHIFRTYFTDVSSIYEFGCGTGFNLIELSKIYTDKRLFGSDFVQSSVDLVNKVASDRALNISSYIFDMIHPDKADKMNPNSGVYTFGSIEQIASQFEDFIKYLLDNNIVRCVHLEPTIELYERNILFDYLASWFHDKRGYTIGLLPFLKKMEREGHIKIIKIVRTGMGSMMMEGFTYMVWEPLKK